MKGIILAGGYGTRLFPATIATSKQLMPIFDKPMIYYPLSLLMLAGIRDILLISTPADIQNFKRLLKDGNHLGINISYLTQKTPRGLADAFIVGEDFIGADDVAMVLGDNIFYGHGLTNRLIRARKTIEENKGAVIFTYMVHDPERYGVVEFDDSNVPVNIIEKPVNPPSNQAVTGLYFYDNSVCDIAKNIKPSARGEIEISCVNQHYLMEKNLSVESLGRGFAWLDTGTHESLIDASNFVSTFEKRQGIKIGCIEEVAFNNGWIDKSTLLMQANHLAKTSYGNYLLQLAKGHLSELPEVEVI